MALTSCAGCEQPIKDKFLLRACNRNWHEDCLKCTCCGCRLVEYGRSLYVRGNLLLCSVDYRRLFGPTGVCTACNQKIASYEMVMRAKDCTFHLTCFNCSACNSKFCVGDRCYILDNHLLCELDYTEQKLYRQTTFSPQKKMCQLAKNIHQISDIEVEISENR